MENLEVAGVRINGTTVSERERQSVERGVYQAMASALGLNACSIQYCTAYELRHEMLVRLERALAGHSVTGAWQVVG